MCLAATRYRDLSIGAMALMTRTLQFARASPLLFGGTSHYTKRTGITVTTQISGRILESSAPSVGIVHSSFALAIRRPSLVLSVLPSRRTFKDTLSPFFESYTLFLECFCVAFEYLSILRNRGMSKQYPLTVFLESPTSRRILKYTKSYYYI